MAGRLEGYQSGDVTRLIRRVCVAGNCRYGNL